MHLTILVNILFGAAALYDAEKREIPGCLNVLIGGLGFFMPGDFFFHLSGAVCGFCVFMTANLIAPGSVGGGDIKFMAAAGSVLGKKKILLASIVGVTAFLGIEASLGKKGEKRPLSPYLVGGILIVEAVLTQI